MKRTFAYGAAANQGSWPAQEDGFFVDPGAGLFVLADGFGGRGNGDIAARTALQEWRSAKFDPAPRESGIYSAAQAWHREMLVEINKKLLQWNDKRAANVRGGCSLLVASVLRERELTVTACGACSAALLRQGRWLSLLAPQAPPRHGPGQPLFPGQALGLGRELNPESRAFEWLPGDLLFLFSSGLEAEDPLLQADLAAQAALRAPGTDLSAIASLAVHGLDGKPSPWNQTLVAVEALP